MVNGEGNTVPDQRDVMQREYSPDVPDEGAQTYEADRESFLTFWEQRITTLKGKRKDRFDRMRKSSAFVKGKQWTYDEVQNDDRYVVNIAQSEVAASVATLYAKNPTFTAKRRSRMDFAIWDESPKSLQEAQMAVVQSQQMGMPAPDAEALLMDVNEGKLRRLNADRTARTLELVFKQQIDQQHPGFKRQMKKLVRRVETTGVGFVKLGFQRIGEVNPEAASRVNDLASRLAHIEMLMAKVDKGEIDAAESSNYQAEAEELRNAIKSLEQNAEKNTIVTKEGLVYSFPKSTAILIDDMCTEMEGFEGARFIVEEYLLTRDIIKTIYKKDMKNGKSYVKEKTDRGGWSVSTKKNNKATHCDDLYCVWEVYDSYTGTVFTMAEGCKEYLREPAAPDVVLERFFPYYALQFNEVEDEEDGEIYAESTVWLIMHPQREINRAKEALRQHRIASRPHYAAIDGALSEQDDQSLSEAPPHAIIKLQALREGQRIDELLQQIKKYPIDPNVYETNSALEDIRLITRRPTSRLGGTSNATATADSMAEESRQVEDRSKADDLDDMLSALARDSATTLFLNMSREQVMEIAGKGATWPENGQGSELLKDITLEVQAGSSGRPNRALEVATFQRLFPVLVQTPGVNPNWLAKTAVKLADSTVDLTEAYLESAPSIQAMNQMAAQSAKQSQTGTGDPATDPAMQGGQGGDKAPRPGGGDGQFSISQGANEIPNTASQNSILL